MWVYSDKKILTPRKGPVQAFFTANQINDKKSVDLEIHQPTPDTLTIKKVW